MSLKLSIALALVTLSGFAVLSNLPSQAASAACDRQMIMQIDSAKVSIEPDGFSVDAFGTSESMGWKGATLIVSQQSGDTATIDFVGCRPEVSAQKLTPIQTSVMLDIPLDTKRLIIRAKTNSMIVEVNGQ